MINEKMYELGKSGSVIRELFEFGKKQKAIFGEDKVYDFSIGNPSIPSPKEVTNEIKRLVSEVDPVLLHGYTSAQGDLGARNKIAENLNLRFNAGVKGDLIYLTQGASAGLTISLKALIVPNNQEEVIVFTPFFPEYSVFIDNAGGKEVRVSPSLDTMYPNMDEFKKKISFKTKAVIINSPNNPTGVVYPSEVIMQICDILKAKEKEYGHPIYLISDEPYRELVYIDNFTYPFITNYYKNSLVIYSLSKSVSLPGERIGYILVNPQMEEASHVFKAICGGGRSQGFVCASSLFQYVFKTAVDVTSDISKYKKNRDLLCSLLDELGYEYIPSHGAFYLFMKALEDDAYAFMEKAKEFNLMLVPSDSFGVKGYVRIAYCVKEKTIIDSKESFRKLKEYYKGKE
jgi:aspartate aminotransferase